MKISSLLKNAMLGAAGGFLTGLLLVWVIYPDFSGPENVTKAIMSISTAAGGALKSILKKDPQDSENNK